MSNAQERFIVVHERLVTGNADRIMFRYKAAAEDYAKLIVNNGTTAHGEAMVERETRSSDQDEWSQDETFRLVFSDEH